MVEPTEQSNEYQLRDGVPNHYRGSQPFRAREKARLVPTWHEIKAFGRKLKPATETAPPVEDVLDTSLADPTSDVNELERIDGVTESDTAALEKAGYKTIGAVNRSPVAKIVRKTGLSKDLVEKIKLGIKL